MTALFPFRAAALSCTALLAASLPLFVCSPLTSDTVLYDLQARTLLQGGVLYRDILEPNLPGIVWLHVLIRSILGWSTEAIRMADLLIVGGALCLLGSLVSRSREGLLRAENPCRNITFVLAAAIFYLSRNEWCHCQRDSWMLLPVSAALWLRYLQRTSRAAASRRLPLAEGVLWGMALWIKPHVVISVVALSLFDLVTVPCRRSELRRLRLVISGGLLAGIPGICWLIASGAGPHFLNMQLSWNPEYLASGHQRRSLERLWHLLIRFHPWWIVHVLCVPLALQQVFTRSRPESSPDDANTVAQGTAASGLPSVALRSSILSDLAIVYFSWLAQSLLLQHAMDYIQVPPFILGLAFLAARPWQLPVPCRRTAVVAFLGLTILISPQLQPARLRLWWTCVTAGTSSEVMATLACGRYPDWEHLQAVENFLSDQELSAQELTCYNVHCIHAYAALDLLPSTRYVGISSLLELFPSRADQIRDAVVSCPDRFVLADISETPAMPDQYPWNLPVAFASGPFRVYETATRRGISGPGQSGQTLEDPVMAALLSEPREVPAAPE